MLGADAVQSSVNHRTQDDFKTGVPTQARFDWLKHDPTVPTLVLREEEALVQLGDFDCDQAEFEAIGDDTRHHLRDPRRAIPGGGALPFAGDLPLP
jgi:hypothetical protein